MPVRASFVAIGLALILPANIDVDLIDERKDRSIPLPAVR
jgi:hypothetical protein